METYEKRIICLNCGKVKVINIPKGMTVMDFMKAEICENCGCSLR